MNTSQTSLPGMDAPPPLPDPAKDGVDHINIYSKATTELGRELSNFAKTPFTHEGVRFWSVEAWWYWQSLIQFKPRAEADAICLIYGFKAKAMGRAFHGNRPVKPPTKEALMQVYRAKMDGNPRLRELLMSSTLPFEHYYVYGGRATQTNWRWTGRIWGEIRDELIAAEATPGKAATP